MHAEPPQRPPADLFDRGRLQIKPLADRKHDLGLGSIKPLESVLCIEPALRAVAAHILAARDAGAAVVLMMGAHVLREGMQRYLVDLMKRRLVTQVALNGAGLIHDFELALIGQTTESVARYIAEGQFGLWQETGRINDLVAAAARNGLGLGEAVGAAIAEGAFPHKDISLLAHAWRLGVPVTVHVGIGYDIVYEHPNCDGAAWGAASYTDFLRFTKGLERLEGGVVMNFGSAIMAPEIYLKALAMVRNAARPEGRTIAHFATLVCDLHDLPTDFHAEAPRGTAGYYYRPWKTMLVRTVADGGESFYVRGRHAQTIPELWSAVNEVEAARARTRPA
ncbi:MAG: hypothetical protein KA248_06960 [Kiritimatiellae bacterium]|nr:hypothetical protein [Kiritimatiellia bacterium]